MQPVALRATRAPKPSHKTVQLRQRISPRKTLVGKRGFGVPIASKGYSPRHQRINASIKRLIYRITRLGKPARPVFADVKMIFQANPKFAINHDHWFIAKTHPRREW